MLKLMVFARKRDDLSKGAFERYLRDTHMPLLTKMPGLQRLVLNHVLPDPTGSPPAWDVVAEDWFDGPEARRVEPPRIAQRGPWPSKARARAGQSAGPAIVATRYSSCSRRRAWPGKTPARFERRAFGASYRLHSAAPSVRAGATLAVNHLDRRPRRRFSDRVHPFFGALALIAGLASLWLVVGFFWAFVVFYGIFVAALVLVTI